MVDYNTISPEKRILCLRLTLEQALEEIFPPNRTHFLTTEQEASTNGRANAHGADLVVNTRQAYEET
jgi:hypothetical protein